MSFRSTLSCLFDLSCASSLGVVNVDGSARGSRLPGASCPLVAGRPKIRSYTQPLIASKV
jgi:hypothetical protein